jgi:hypothetical protein
LSAAPPSEANDAGNNIPPARSSDIGVRNRRTWWNGHDFRRRTISDDQARHSQKEPPRDDLPRPSDASGLAEVNGIELAWQTLFELLGGGLRDASWDRSGMTKHRLAILPGVTHYDMNVAPRLAAAIAGFLDEA